MAKLTDRFIAALQLDKGRKDRLVFDSECRGLGVRVTRNTRTFIVQWSDRVNKRKVREPLGVWGSITIEQARSLARAHLGDVARGINPREARRQAAIDAKRAHTEALLTFEALVSEWASLHLAHRRRRYAEEAVRAIRYGLPTLLKLPAARITRADAVNALDQIVKSGKVVTAGRTMAYARACFAWAERRGKVPQNPFAGLPVSAAAVERDRVLSDAELGEIWAATGALAYPFGPFYRLAALTLQRRDEVAGMRWSEIAADLSVWRIPGARMKNRRAHDVHLSQSARAVLADLPRVEGCDLVFTTTGKTPISGFSQGKRYLDAAILKARAAAAETTEHHSAPLVPWRLHDFRRTGVTKLAGLGFDSIVVDKLLAHQPAKLRGVAAVYQRYDFADERARALDAWAVHLEEIDGGNVVPLRRVAG